MACYCSNATSPTGRTGSAISTMRTRGTVISVERNFAFDCIRGFSLLRGSVHRRPRGRALQLYPQSISTRRLARVNIELAPMCSACHGALVIVKGDTKGKEVVSLSLLPARRQRDDFSVAGGASGRETARRYCYRSLLALSTVNNNRFAPPPPPPPPRVKTAPLTMPSARVYDVDLGASYWPIRNALA